VNKKDGKWPILGRQFVTIFSSLMLQDPLSPSQGLFFSPSEKFNLKKTLNKTFFELLQVAYYEIYMA
jgi:hypothetical protein